jgi:hypothetical protein
LPEDYVSFGRPKGGMVASAFWVNTRGQRQIESMVTIADAAFAQVFTKTRCNDPAHYNAIYEQLNLDPMHGRIRHPTPAMHATFSVTMGFADKNSLVMQAHGHLRPTQP